MKQSIIYTFELRKSKDEIIKLICGDPWSFQDQQSAKLLFTEYLCNLWEMDLNSALIIPYMSKGVLVQNKGSEYIKFSMSPDKLCLNHYKILM
tara:strand:+ start:590 stop:868 length:279 start_codon:yes stop_codon:yes gene_type:complete